MTTLTRLSLVPNPTLVSQLEQDLHDHYRCGDYLPTEQDLAQRFSVNRQSVSRAVDELAARGLVQRRQGQGILVLMRPWSYPLGAKIQVSQSLREQGSHPTCEKLLAVLRPASFDVASALACEEGQSIIHLRTLRRIDGIPLCTIDHYLPDLSWWPALQAFRQGSLHGHLQARLGITLSRQQAKISARLARAKEASQLTVGLNTPLMCLRTLSLKSGSPQVAEYAVTLSRADMLELTLEY